MAGHWPLAELLESLDDRQRTLLAEVHRRHADQMAAKAFDGPKGEMPGLRAAARYLAAVADGLVEEVAA